MRGCLEVLGIARRLESPGEIGDRSVERFPGQQLHKTPGAAPDIYKCEAGRDCLSVAIISRRILRNEGQGRVDAEIIKFGTRKGIRFTLVAEEVSPELLDLPGVEWAKIASSAAPTQLVQNIIFAFASTRWLRFHRQQLDVIHVNGFVTFGRSDVNVVHFVHDGWLRTPVLRRETLRSVRGFYQTVYTLVHAWLERGAFARTRSAIAVSNSVRDEIVRLGMSERAVHVVSNGVDVSEPRPSPLKRDELGVPESCFLLLFAGDLQTPRKNMDTLLQALLLVPDAHLAVAGTVRSQRYPLKCKALGLSDRVHFMSFRKDDMPELMASADAVVMTSLYEPFGLVVLEAMAAGTAIITASSVGSSTLVGGAGIVLPDAEDSVALANAIRYLSTHQEVRAEMGAMGRKIARQCTWERMANRYVEIYESIGHEVHSFKSVS